MLLVPVCFVTGSISPSSGLQVLQEDDWETGDFSQWTGFMTSGVGFVHVQKDAGIDGSYCLNATLASQLNSGQKAHVYKFIEDTDAVTQKMIVKYLYNLLNSSEQTLFTYMHQNSQGPRFSTWGLAYHDSHTVFYMSYFNGSTWTTHYVDDPLPELGVWYSLKFTTEIGEGTGEVQFYIDNVLKANYTGLFNVHDGYSTVNLVVAGLKEDVWSAYPEIGVLVDNFMAVSHLENIVGDITLDGEVNVDDLLILNTVYGMKSGDFGWNPDSDLDCDMIVDVCDLELLGKDWQASV